MISVVLRGLVNCSSSDSGRNINLFTFWINIYIVYLVFLLFRFCSYQYSFVLNMSSVGGRREKINPDNQIPKFQIKLDANLLFLACVRGGLSNCRICWWLAELSFTVPPKTKTQFTSSFPRVHWPKGRLLLFPVLNE